MPEQMPFDEAAAIPHAAALAVQGLCEIGELKSGQKVLINGAGGGVGGVGRCARGTTTTPPSCREPRVRGRSPPPTSRPDTAS